MENYKSVEPPDQEKQICGVIKDRNDTRTIAFVNKPPNARRIAREARTFETFHKTNKIVENVLHHTNTKIIETVAKLPENFNENWLYPCKKNFNR